MHSFNPPSWLKEKRAFAQERLHALGWPSRHDEAWRYTTLKSFLNQNFRVEDEGAVHFDLPSEVLSFLEKSQQVLCFYNGHFLPLSFGVKLQERHLVAPLSKVLVSSGRVQDSVRQSLSREPNENLKKIGWLNQAYSYEGACVRILEPNRGEWSQVIVLNLYDGGEPSRGLPFAVYPRHLFYFGEGVKAEILQAHISMKNAVFQVNTAADWFLSDGAEVRSAEYVDLGDAAYFFNDVFVRVGARADHQSAHIVKGGGLTRNELHVRLEKPGAMTKVNSLALAEGHSHIDTSSFIHHVSGETTSEQMAKSVLRDSSRTVFSGRLLIDQDAQKSSASQYNHNLLLGDHAEADTRPQLEVYADDVKAAHGATVGQMSEQEIFYLQSRGLPKETAKSLLVEGFQSDVFPGLDSEFLKNKLMDTMSLRLR